jgi:hypothetical protein
LVGDMRLPGQAVDGGGDGHGVRKDAGAVGSVWCGVAGAPVAGTPVGAAGLCSRGAGARQGLRLCGKVARPAEAGELGNFSGPFCPQALNATAQPTRASAVTRIFGTFNMLRL